MHQPLICDAWMQAASRRLIVMEQDAVEADPMALVLKLREQVQSSR